MDADRLAIVSGGATGIGRGIAARLLEDGLEVLLVGRRADLLAEAAAALGETCPGAAVSWRSADVADAADVDALTTALRGRGRRVDVVVANAGGPQATSGESLADVVESWEGALRANLLTAVALVTGLEPLLVRPGGRIVLIGSKAARTGGASPGYVAAKAALEGWVRHLAARLGPDGVTANLVAPGLVDGTDLIAGRLSDDRRARIVSATAAGRVGTPADIAAAVSFLVSAGGGYVNGQVLAVDGGDLPSS